MGDRLREDTHKKVFFLVVGPLWFYPPYTNGLVVHATFFFLAGFKNCIYVSILFVISFLYIVSTVLFPASILKFFRM